MDNFVFNNYVNWLIYFLLHIFRDEGVVGGNTSALACDPSNEHQPKCEKGPLSHQKMKCLFVDYIQYLMIS